MGVIVSVGPTGDALPTEEIDMSIMDKVKQMVGGAKEKIGDATGNDRMADSGKSDQLSGEAQDAAGELKDKATGAMKDTKDKLAD